MNLVVRRKGYSSLSITGELWDRDVARLCYTMEPPERGDGLKPRAIPLGTYDLTIRYSDRFQRLMPHVEEVPGFDGILIHWGNRPGDTEGCLLVGLTLGPAPNWIGSSRAAFDILFPMLAQSSEPGTITYVRDIEPAPDAGGEISV